MEENKPESISYFVHEGEMARQERHTKWWRNFAIVIFCALLASNIGWVVYESQYQDIVVTQDTPGGNNNFIGHNGDITNGEANNQDQAKESGR